MRYFMLVNKLPQGYEEGHYIRPEENGLIYNYANKISSEILNNKGLQTAVKVAKNVMPVDPQASLKYKIGAEIINSISDFVENNSANQIDLPKNNPSSFIKSDTQLKNWNFGGISIDSYGLKNNYTIEPKSFLSVIMDYVPKFNSSSLKKLMNSGGGQNELIILEKEKLPRTFHISDKGYFDNGLYIQHPKFSDKLIPLKNSVKHIQDLIISEMTTVLCCLGAKKITINETNEKDAKLALSNKKAKIDLSFNKKETSLFYKEFGNNGIDIKRAKRETLFTADMPNFISIFKNRENGNQVIETFIETVEVNAGLDVQVLGLFNPISGTFSSKKYWSMEVEFFDKNELKNSWLKKIF